MKILKSLPPKAVKRPRKEGLRTHQIRVLRALAKRPLSRSQIAEKASISPTVTSRALGYEDAEARAKFEDTNAAGGYPSLLTLGLVEEVTLDVDGRSETLYEVTKEGEKALSEVKAVKIPPPRQ